MARINPETKLNERQELFCQYYVSQEFFANGSQSYIEAYGIDPNDKKSVAAARVSAHDNLLKPNILARINALLDLSGFNDEFVDKQLLLVITQNAELGPKVAAMREYNALKKRITQKIEHSGEVTLKGLLNEIDGQSKGLSTTETETERP